MAGAAHEHPWIMVFGLVLSIALMGVAATFIAKLLHRYRWIGYIGLVVVLYVALHMIWDGARQVVVRTGNLEQFNASAPGFLEIGEEEAAHHLGRQRSETSEVPGPAEPDPAIIKRLFAGINLVGIWDELFFVNTAFALLRSLFNFRVANTMQAILYTAVLYDMAFTGCGIFIVFFFAWTQGSMFEKSESLLWVLLVHLIVDYFLVAFIVQAYYPDYGLDFLWRKGF